jgi:hypothetical protein
LVMLFFCFFPAPKKNRYPNPKKFENSILVFGFLCSKQLARHHNIATTTELAAQVQNSIGWILAPAGWPIWWIVASQAKVNK